MSSGLPPPEPMPPKVLVVDLNFANTLALWFASPPLPDYYPASYTVELDPSEETSTAFIHVEGPRRGLCRGPRFIITPIVPRGCGRHGRGHSSSRHSSIGNRWFQTRGWMLSEILFCCCYGDVGLVLMVVPVLDRSIYVIFLFLWLLYFDLWLLALGFVVIHL